MAARVTHGDEPEASRRKETAAGESEASRSRARESAPVFSTFVLYRSRESWPALAPADRAEVAGEVERTLTAVPGIRLRGLYSLVGFREDADLMIWAAADEIAPVQTLPAALNATRFARYFGTAGVYPAIAKTSPYTGAHVPAFIRGVPPQRFVVMYPFVKTPEWYLLPFEERARMMADHGRIGAQWPSVYTNTLYAFGLGDYEFVVAFETASPFDFLRLVERLRETEVRRFTQRDTPIYLGARKPFWGVFADLGVPHDRTTLLLEEPAETITALREGRQVALLRRGGTKENAYGAPGDLLLLCAEGSERVDLAARVRGVLDVVDDAQLEAWSRLQPALGEEARERFGWRGPGQPLRALLVRVFAIPAAPRPLAREGKGEWTELATGVPLLPRTPVLDDEEFTRRCDAVREALTVRGVQA